MARDVLFVAYHFPPILQSSGLHRIVAFVDQLAETNREVRVLTITKNALPQVSEDGMGEVDSRVKVSRAWGLDTAKHLSLFGRYPAFLAVPDRYWTWVFPSVRLGKRLLRRMDNPVIISSFPIPSAHNIAKRLSKQTGVPWIADFRDPMYDPAESPLRLQKLEREAVALASFVTVTTPSTKSLFIERYGEFCRHKIHVIPNGYGKTVRDLAATQYEQPSCSGSRTPYVLLHSGSIYGDFRNPSQFFKAIAESRTQGVLSSESLRIVFRGASPSQELVDLVEHLSIDDIVEFAPLVPHSQAVREMTESHAYLILQGTQFNAQIPAKLYEYLALRRPILALTDRNGATAKEMEGIPAVFQADMQSVPEIVSALSNLMEQLRRDPQSRLMQHDVTRFDRSHGAKAICELVSNAGTS